MALRLSDWLGLARECTARPVIPLLAPPPGLPAPRCRRWRGRISSRRASAVAEEANAGPGGPMNWLTIIAAYAVRFSDLVRWLQVIVFARRRIVFRPRLAFCSRCPCSSRVSGWTDRAVRSCRAHRPFPVAQLTPRGVDFAGAPHGTACFVRPNVGAPLERGVRPRCNNCNNALMCDERLNWLT